MLTLPGEWLKRSLCYLAPLVAAQAALGAMVRGAVGLGQGEVSPGGEVSPWHAGLACEGAGPGGKTGRVCAAVHH